MGGPRAIPGDRPELVPEALTRHHRVLGNRVNPPSQVPVAFAPIVVSNCEPVMLKAPLFRNLRPGRPLTTSR